MAHIRRITLVPVTHSLAAHSQIGLGSAGKVADRDPGPAANFVVHFQAFCGFNFCTIVVLYAVRALILGSKLHCVHNFSPSPVLEIQLPCN